MELERDVHRGDLAAGTNFGHSQFLFRRAPFILLFLKKPPVKLRAKPRSFLLAKFHKINFRALVCVTTLGDGQGYFLQPAWLIAACLDRKIGSLRRR
jgi:hypothetical protein